MAQKMSEERAELARQARVLEARIQDYCTMYESEQWFKFKMQSNLTDRQFKRLLRDAGVYFEPDF